MAAVGMATLASCAVVPQTLTYQATVDAIAAPNASAKRRYFLRHIEAGKEGDLQFLEFGAYVHHALERRGFIRAESVADADIVIGLGYAIGDSETYSYTYRVPRVGADRDRVREHFRIGFRRRKLFGDHHLQSDLLSHRLLDRRRE
jgi:hypothetical protein